MYRNFILSAWTNKKLSLVPQILLLVYQNWREHFVSVIKGTSVPGGKHIQLNVSDWLVLEHCIYCLLNHTEKRTRDNLEFLCPTTYKQNILSNRAFGIARSKDRKIKCHWIQFCRSLGGCNYQFSSAIIYWLDCLL